MRYLLFICSDEAAEQTWSREEEAGILARYGAFAEEMTARGAIQVGARLRPTTDATTVQVRDGQVLTTDGPFAETKEQIAGFYMVDAADLDEAIEIAAKLPGAAYGTIEVRPVWET